MANPMNHRRSETSGAVVFERRDCHGGRAQLPARDRHSDRGSRRRLCAGAKACGYAYSTYHAAALARRFAPSERQAPAPSPRTTATTAELPENGAFILAPMGLDPRACWGHRKQLALGPRRHHERGPKPKSQRSQSRKSHFAAPPRPQSRQARTLKGFDERKAQTSRMGQRLPCQTPRPVCSSPNAIALKVEGRGGLTMPASRFTFPVYRNAVYFP